PFLDGRDAHPTRTSRIVSYLILIPYIRYINSGVTGIDINGGHVSAVSLQLIGVGKRHWRVLMVRVCTGLPLWGNINSDAAGFDITSVTSEESESVAELPSSSIRYIWYIARWRTSSPL
ncbi:hypothetical protein, partial [Microcoleus sp. BROC3]|uniref:hypothetical protein n=1 Tax=Microcoleus sp. BROC3 TaxID=3055323 RepID=UPI002FD5C284